MPRGKDFQVERPIYPLRYMCSNHRLDVWEVGNDCPPHHHNPAMHATVFHNTLLNLTYCACDLQVFLIRQ